MSIFLLVLKIAGLILLVALGVLCFLILVVFFFPVKYRIWGSFHDKKLNMKARIFFLLHLAGFFLNIDGSSRTMYLRILGIKKNLKERDNPEKFEDTIKDTGQSIKTSVVDPTAEQELQMLSLDETKYKKTEEAENGHKSALKSKLVEIWQKLKQSIRRFKDFLGRLWYMITHVREKAEEINQIYRDESNRAAFRKLKSNLFSVLKYLSPKKSKLNLTFSAGSPDITGEALGILSLFPFGYKYHWNIMPDFVSEEAYLEADFDFKGHLYGIQILVLLLGIVLDKNCQKLYNKIMKMK